jgi:hypothetical protein
MLPGVELKLHDVCLQQLEVRGRVDGRRIGRGQELGEKCGCPLDLVGTTSFATGTSVVIDEAGAREGSSRVLETSCSPSSAFVP